MDKIVEDNFIINIFLYMYFEGIFALYPLQNTF